MLIDRTSNQNQQNLGKPAQLSNHNVSIIPKIRALIHFFQAQLCLVRTALPRATIITLDAYTCSIVNVHPAINARSAMEPTVSDVTCQPSWMLDVARVGLVHSASCVATVVSSHVDRGIDERALLRDLCVPAAVATRGSMHAMHFERVPGAGVVRQRKRRAWVGVGERGTTHWPRRRRRSLLPPASASHPLLAPTSRPPWWRGR